jgi:hypothetical protein
VRIGKFARTVDHRVSLGRSSGDGVSVYVPVARSLFGIAISHHAQKSGWDGNVLNAERWLRRQIFKSWKVLNEDL